MKTSSLIPRCRPALRCVGWGLSACCLFPAPAVAQPSAPAALAVNASPVGARHRAALPEAPSARAATALSITDLAAAATAQGILLTWTAPIGKVPGRLDVERSTDGTTFRPLGTVGPADATAYRFVDAHPATPPVYYRLRQPGGPASEILTYAAADNAWQPSPNPAADWLSCGPASGDYRIQDAVGRTVLTGRLTTGQRIDVRRLRNGNYTLELRNGAVRITRSFLKFTATEHP